VNASNVLLDGYGRLSGLVLLILTILTDFTGAPLPWDEAPHDRDRRAPSPRHADRKTRAAIRTVTKAQPSATSRQPPRRIADSSASRAD
jgi:hypothetical protein